MKTFISIKDLNGNKILVNLSKVCIDSLISSYLTFEEVELLINEGS